MLTLAAMNDESWRKRLFAAIEAEINKGRSARQISIAAGLGPNFVNQLMKSGREPSVGNFLALTKELGVSPIKILTGLEVTPTDEELLRVYAGLSEEGRQQLLRLFQELRGI